MNEPSAKPQYSCNVSRITSYTYKGIYKEEMLQELTETGCQK